MDFPGVTQMIESACNAGDLGWIPGSGRSPGEGMTTHSSTPLPGEFHKQRSWAGSTPWDCKESDTTA